MKDMPKDRELEREFREYFDGTEAPRCDLSHAKRALAAPEKKPRRWIAAVISACATAAAAFLLCCILIPYSARQARTFTLEDTEHRAVSVAEVKENYNKETRALTRFERAENAVCSYTAVERKGETVLLRADLSYYSPRVRFDATVYIDVSAGKYDIGDFDEYSELAHKSGGILYESETDGATGSIFSRVYAEGDKTAYYISMLSDQPQALDFLLRYLHEYF